jgi:hypothetical protein
MSNDEYWNDSEFGFFNTLEDEDKLLYLYDLMLGDFVHEYNGDDVEDVFEIEFEEDPVEPIHQNVDVSFDDRGNLVFAGSNVMLLRKVAGDMMMNGLILQNSQLSLEDDVVKLSYELIGKSEAISVN